MISESLIIRSTLVDQVEDKMLSYFKAHNLGPGDPIPKGVRTG